VDAGELIAAMQAVRRGDYLVDPVIAKRVLSEFHVAPRNQAPAEPLTDGEMAVLRLVAQGIDNQQIAAELQFSINTVANRLRSIYQKLSVNNRTQAALYALRQGWARLDIPPA
jgi:NarL family two-component system response regulator LiaR